MPTNACRLNWGKKTVGLTNSVLEEVLSDILLSLSQDEAKRDTSCRSCPHFYLTSSEGGRADLPENLNILKIQYVAKDALEIL